MLMRRRTHWAFTMTVSEILPYTAARYDVTRSIVALYVHNPAAITTAAITPATALADALTVSFVIGRHPDTSRKS